MRFLLFAVSFIVLFSAKIEAQIDPSSAMLLNTDNRAAVHDSGIDSGRYTVRPKVDGRRDDRNGSHRTTVETKTKTTTTSATTQTQQPAAAPFTPLSPAAPSTQTTTTSGTFIEAKPVEVAPVVETSGPQITTDESDDDDDDSATDEKPAVATFDDRRSTVLELSFSPGYLYNESKSTFAPRNYNLNAPVMSVDAKVWVSPNFGVHTNYLGTINANVTDSLDNTKNTIASNQWFAVGAQSRRFFGQGALAPTLQLSLDYREFEFRVPSDSKMRNKLVTSGVFLLLDAEVPTSGFGSWIFGAEFGPKLQHRETSAATEFRTGEDPQTTTVGVHLGARYRFDHTQSVFWKVSYGAERNLFSGSTTIPDPVSGSPQTNVSVTNAFTLFQLGYTWSD